MPSPNKPRRLGMAGVAVVVLAAIPTIAVGWDQRIVTGAEHFVDCVNWIINDPAKWRRNCQPSRPVTPIEGATTPAGGVAPAAPAAPASSSLPPSSVPSSSSEPERSSSSSTAQPSVT